MELKLSYRFDRTEGNGRGNVGSGQGYVLPPTLPLPPSPALATPQNPKISFIGNSGVKIGGTGGFSKRTGPHEIQIIDMDALIAMGEMEVVPNSDPNESPTITPGVIANFLSSKFELFYTPDLPNGQPDPLYVTGDPLDPKEKRWRIKNKAMGATVQYGVPPQQTDLEFAAEEVSALMHGIVYGQKYENMKDFNTAAGTLGTAERYRNTLEKNYENCPGNSFKMEIRLIA